MVCFCHLEQHDLLIEKVLKGFSSEIKKKINNFLLLLVCYKISQDNV